MATILEFPKKKRQEKECRYEARYFDGTVLRGTAPVDDRGDIFIPIPPCGFESMVVFEFPVVEKMGLDIPSKS